MGTKLFENIGFAFAGGGGKGAWQIGVWKALKERGIIAKAASGTSVGCLNAVLYAQGDYDKAVQAWMTISHDKLLAPNFDAVFNKYPQWRKKTERFFSGKLSSTHGVFSQAGLAHLIENYLDFSKKNSFLPTFAAAHCKDDESIRYFEMFSPERFPRESWSDEDLKNIMLASAAIPGIFSDIEIDGKLYSDGGFDLIYALSDGAFLSSRYNNTPIEPLVNNADRLGIDTVILLALSRDELSKRPSYGKVRVLPFLPSQDLGGILNGCLDFNPEHAKKRMEQGYQDAQKWLDLICGFAENEGKLSELWDSILKGEENYFEAMHRIASANKAAGSLEADIRDFNRCIQSDDGLIQLETQTTSLTLEDMIRRHDLMLIDSIEREELDHLVENLVAENRDNATLLANFAMDTAAALVPVESRGIEYFEYGFFSHLWHGITGKNQKLVANSIINLAQAQYASLALIQRLQSENLLQFELTGALCARLNRLAGDVAHVQENTNVHIREVYHSMALVYCKVRRQLIDLTEKQNRMEHEQQVMRWLHEIEYKTFNGKELSRYPAPIRLVLTALDFYQTVNGEVDKNFLLFRKALSDLNLDQELISIREIRFESQKEASALKICRNRFVISKEGAWDKEDWTPILRKEECEVSGMDVKQSPLLLGQEMFYYLKAKGWKPRTESESGIRQEYLEKCDKLNEIIATHQEEFGQKLIPEINMLKEKIANWYFKVYLIGGFSCGKSSLLNRWLGTNILPHGIQPETAVSTELFYSQKERMLLYPAHANLPVTELPGVTEANIELMKKRANRGELLRVQIYLNNPVLASYPDICLVDMPGLSSAIPAHEFALNQFIQEEGIGIFCVAAKDGTVSNAGVQFLHKMNSFRCGFYLLITKSDEVTPKDLEEITESINTLMQSNLGIPESEFQSGTVSRHSSGDFTRLLNLLCENRDAFFRCIFDDDFNALCQSATYPLEMLLSRDLSTGKLDEAIEKIQANAKELPGFIESVSHDIQREIPPACSRIVEQTKSHLRGMKRTFKAQIKTGQDCSGELSSQMKSVILYGLNNEARDIFSQVVRKATEKLGSVLSFSINAEAISADSLGGMKSDNYAGTGTMLGLAGGAVTGAALGSIIPGIGTLIGAGIGALFGGLGGHYAGSKVDDDSELDSELTMHMERQAENARSTIEDAFQKCTAKFKTDLQEAMEKKLSILSEQMNQIKRQIAQNQQDFDAQRAIWRTALDKLIQLVIKQ